MYVSNSATFEITDISNSSKCLGSGYNGLKVRILGKRGSKN